MSTKRFDRSKVYFHRLRYSAAETELLQENMRTASTNLIHRIGSHVLSQLKVDRYRSLQIHRPRWLLMAHVYWLYVAVVLKVQKKNTDKLAVLVQTLVQKFLSQLQAEVWKLVVQRLFSLPVVPDGVPSVKELRELLCLGRHICTIILLLLLVSILVSNFIQPVLSKVYSSIIGLFEI